MSLLEQMEQLGHESLHVHRDERSGLKAIVAIHSTVLGPALGGTRWYPYPNEDDALRDVLRLSSAMTAKAAVAGLDLGGGKAVVLGDPHDKTLAQIESYARFIDSFGGRYITTTDVDTTTAEMNAIRGHTPHVVGVGEDFGGGGDTSELTAITLTEGMRAALRVAYDDESFEGRHIVMLGIGKVGAKVARIVAERGARVTVSDVREEALAQLAVELDARHRRTRGRTRRGVRPAVAERPRRPSQSRHDPRCSAPASSVAARTINSRTTRTTPGSWRPATSSIRPTTS